MEIMTSLSERIKEEINRTTIMKEALLYLIISVGMYGDSERNMNR